LSSHAAIDDCQAKRINRKHIAVNDSNSRESRGVRSPRIGRIAQEQAE
jgi:hypothetical protein